MNPDTIGPGSHSRVDVASLRLVVAIFAVFVLYLACTVAEQLQVGCYGSTCVQESVQGERSPLMPSKRRRESYFVSGPVSYGRILQWKVEKIERIYAVRFSRDGERVDMGFGGPAVASFYGFGVTEVFCGCVTAFMVAFCPVILIK